MKFFTHLTQTACTSYAYNGMNFMLSESDELTRLILNLFLIWHILNELNYAIIVHTMCCW